MAKKPEPAPLPTCATCAYHYHDDQSVGKPVECRRRAPTQLSVVAAWPKVHAHSWCGEWAGEIVAPSDAAP